jgi:hypothetical protein
MAKRRIQQPGLFDEPAPVVLPPRELTYRERLLEQIRRDMDTLRDGQAHDEWMEQFYRDRLASYREEVKSLP